MSNTIRIVAMAILGFLMFSYLTFWQAVIGGIAMCIIFSMQFGNKR